MHIKFNGITNKMPAKKAPAKMIRILPALELPAKGVAAPTLKPRVALAILEELRSIKRTF